MSTTISRCSNCWSAGGDRPLQARTAWEGLSPVTTTRARTPAAVVGERAGALHGEGSVLEGLRSCSFPVAFLLLRFQGS